MKNEDMIKVIEAHIAEKPIQYRHRNDEKWRDVREDLRRRLFRRWQGGPQDQPLPGQRRQGRPEDLRHLQR